MCIFSKNLHSSSLQTSTFSSHRHLRPFPSMHQNDEHKQTRCWYRWLSLTQTPHIKDLHQLLLHDQMNDMKTSWQNLPHPSHRCPTDAPLSALVLGPVRRPAVPFDALKPAIVFKAKYRGGNAGVGMLGWECWAGNAGVGCLCVTQQSYTRV